MGVTGTSGDTARTPSRKLRIGILFGGRSGEHEVSLISARGIIEAIDQEQYELVLIGITREGRWVVGNDPLAVLSSGQDAGHLRTVKVSLETRDNLKGISSENELQLQSLDVIFPVLHGPYGEDGTVQGLLEVLGVPYVGAGVLASAVAMDKAVARQLFAANGLPVLPYRVFLSRIWESRPEEVIAECEDVLHYPMFTKPANLGSSVGVSKVHNRAELEAGLYEAARYDRKIVVEQGIEAREIEVSVLGNDTRIVSVPGEIIPSREFYSYAAKYLDNASQLLIPAPLSSREVRRIQEIALKACAVIDCAGMARVDFLMDKRSGEIWLSEINTIPGFTPISMYPKLWEASGISYAELIDRLIQLALERFEHRQRYSARFDPSRAT
ncbi:MAG: D-alanine--D-alanine ligase family protein [Anaerolineae bacterium]